MKLAIFDFDGTLLMQETIPFLLRHYKSDVRYKSKFRYRLQYFGVLTQLILLLLAYRSKLNPNLDKEQFRRKATALYLNLLEGRTESELSTYFEAVAYAMKPHFNPRVVEAMLEQERKGHRILLLSGCFSPLLHHVVKVICPIGHTFINDVDLVATPLTYDEKNQLLPLDVESIISGDNKTAALLAYLKDDPIDWASSLAYADSYYDIPVMSLVGYPIAVTPDRLLEDHAIKHNWEIMK